MKDAKSKALKGMKEGIHRVGKNPSRFVHREPKGKFDLYEKWENGKQSFKRTTNKDH